ncbi:putative xylogalacturonan beta-1,3-xylosyltransferase [Helianthus annuus]|nr:putative xylogalacturonan beta-1,3-xylosyltransferase [Helianthus annuus]
MFIFSPFSVTMILNYLFDPVIRDKAVLERVIGDYVHMVSSRYPYWNQSLGSNHFMLACHDWVGSYSNPICKSFTMCIHSLADLEQKIERGDWGRGDP